MRTLARDRTGATPANIFIFLCSYVVKNRETGWLLGRENNAKFYCSYVLVSFLTAKVLCSYVLKKLGFHK